MRPAHYTKRDYVCALLAALIVFLLAAGTVTRGLRIWGDDSAGYLNEAAAIAEGRLEEQLTLNARMHPSYLPEEVRNGKLVYAWGFPLLEAAVYKAVGFDREGYSSLVYYKLILVASLAVCAGALTLFFRRRFSLKASVLAAVLFCANPRLLEEINKLYGDVTFVCFTVLTFLLAECFVFSEKHAGRVVTGLFYALCMWFTYELRLNGFTVIAAAFFGHAVCFVRKQVRFDARTVCIHAAPYVLCILFVLLSEALLLPKATSNMSDFKRTNIDSIIKNAGIVFGRPFVFFDRSTGIRFYVTGAVMYALCVLGLCRNGFKDNLYLVALWLGSFLVVMLLPYDQGIRYLFNVLPIMLMYMMYGARELIALYRREHERIGFLKNRRLWRILGAGALALVMGIGIVYDLAVGIGNLANSRVDGNESVFTDDAKEAYAYIRQNVAEDKTVRFRKPRMLYLVTGRVSLPSRVNGEVKIDGDYYLFGSSEILGSSAELEMLKRYECVFENEGFALFDLRREATQ